MPPRNDERVARADGKGVGERDGTVVRGEKVVTFSGRTQRAGRGHRPGMVAPRSWAGKRPWPDSSHPPVTLSPGSRAQPTTAWRIDDNAGEDAELKAAAKGVDFDDTPIHPIELADADGVTHRFRIQGIHPSRPGRGQHRTRGRTAARDAGCRRVALTAFLIIARASARSRPRGLPASRTLDSGQDRGSSLVTVFPFGNTRGISELECANRWCPGAESSLSGTSA